MSEWERHQLILPDDDYDEDDALDDFIAQQERKRKERVSRGEGICGTE